MQQCPEYLKFGDDDELVDEDDDDGILPTKSLFTTSLATVDDEFDDLTEEVIVGSDGLLQLILLFCDADDDDDVVGCPSSDERLSFELVFNIDRIILDGRKRNFDDILDVVGDDTMDKAADVIVDVALGTIDEDDVDDEVNVFEIIADDDADVDDDDVVDVNNDVTPLS